MTAKRLELLRALVPGAVRVAVLVNPANPNAETIVRDAEAAAHVMGLQIRVHKAGTTGSQLSSANRLTHCLSAPILSSAPGVPNWLFWRRITEPPRPMRFVTMPKPVG